MFDRDPKVVAIGGGTGLSYLMRGLKRYPIDITAIITVADDGGSSKEFRDFFNMIPPGDIRKVLISMAQADELLEKLFNYRFDKNDSGLAGHPIGNIMLAAMADISGDFIQGIRKMSKVLNVKGTVLPVAKEPLILGAIMDDGNTVYGETCISSYKGKISKIFNKNEKITVCSDAVKAINEADLIVYGPGSLYTSIIPNIIIPEIAEAIVNSNAIKLFISNIMTESNETIGYSASDMLKAVNDHVNSDIIDCVIANDNFDVDDEILINYKKDGSDFVELDFDELAKMGVEVYTSPLAYVNKKNHVRHHSNKLAAQVFSILLEK